ncbi:MAG: RNA polymerase sigma factor [Cyclobacteriaceae bacterium]|nr:RNA polymerase sigma factor [Cyclobacteriaceae bacterium]
MEAQAQNIHSELIARCRLGDRAAYYQIYKLYCRSMYNVGYRIVNNADEAEDVLQEAFTSAFKNLEGYRGDSSFGSWLKRIVINKAINYLHKRKADRLPDDDRWDIAEVVEENNLDAFPFSVEQVRNAMERLPDGYRTVLSLYLLEGYDHAEIGEILKVTESTSKSQYNRAKKKLRELLEEYVK